MASPQKEHGFTPIAHELLRAYMRQGLSGVEWNVLMALLLKTYGQQRKSVEVSYPQLGITCVLARQNVYRAMDSLSRRGLIVVSSLKIETDRRCLKAETGVTKNVEIIKDYDKWVVSSVRQCLKAETGSVITGETKSPQTPLKSTEVSTSTPKAKRQEKKSPVVPFGDAPDFAKLKKRVNDTWLRRKGAGYPWTKSEGTLLANMVRNYGAWCVMALWDLYVQDPGYWGKKTGLMLEGLHRESGRLLENRSWKKIAADLEDADLKAHGAVSGNGFTSTKDLLKDVGLWSKK